jgi:hypothetical protein
MHLYASSTTSIFHRAEKTAGPHAADYLNPVVRQMRPGQRFSPELVAQQKELEVRLQDVQGELAKQEIIYKYLAVQKNDEALAKIKSKRYTSYMVLGGAVVGLTIVIILLAKKKNG